MKELIRKILRESEFDWTDKVDVAPTYEGHPQGVVYLRSHDEIAEFIKLLEEYNGGWIGPHGGYKDFHQAWDSLLDRVEGNDWDGYTDWVPTMTASFFVEKKYLNKLTSGYWDHDVDNGDVEDWVETADEVVDKEHWKIYDDVSQLRTLLGERLVESNDMDWAVEIKPEIDFKNLEDQPFIVQWKDGREVDKGWRIGKVVEKNGKEYILIKGNKNEPWTRWKLILAFQGKMKKYKFKFKDDEIQRNWTITESNDMDWVGDVEPYEKGDYFLDWDGQRCWIADKDEHEVLVGTYEDNETEASYYPYDKDDIDQYFNIGDLKVINESNDFEWTESAPALGRYNADDLYELVVDKRLRIGYTVRLIGYGGDIDRTFNHTGTVIDMYENHIKYQGQGDEDDEFEYGFKVMLNDFNGYDTYEYEVNNTFGDQDLTFDIISNGMNESEFDWTDEADVTWSTYYDEIFRDVLRLPQSIEDVDMDTLLSTYYKLDVLTREVQKGSKLKNTSTFGEIHGSFLLLYLTRIINNVNEGKDQELYVRMKNYMLGDIQEVTRHLKLVGE